VCVLTILRRADNIFKKKKITVDIVDGCYFSEEKKIFLLMLFVLLGFLCCNITFYALQLFLPDLDVL